MNSKIQIYEWDNPRWRAYLVEGALRGETDIDLTQDDDKGRERHLFSFALDFDEKPDESGPIDRRDFAYVVTSGGTWLEAQTIETNKIGRTSALNDVVSKRLYGLFREFGIMPKHEEDCCLLLGRRKILPTFEEVDPESLARILEEVESFASLQHKEGSADHFLSLGTCGCWIGAYNESESSVLLYSGNTSVSVRIAKKKLFKIDVEGFCAKILRRNQLFSRKELDEMSEFGRRVGPDSGDTSALLQAMGFQSFFQMPNYVQWLEENEFAGGGS